MVASRDNQQTDIFLPTSHPALEVLAAAAEPQPQRRMEATDTEAVEAVEVVELETPLLLVLVEEAAMATLYLQH